MNLANHTLWLYCFSTLLSFGVFVITVPSIHLWSLQNKPAKFTLYATEGFHEQHMTALYIVQTIKTISTILVMEVLGILSISDTQCCWKLSSLNMQNFKFPAFLVLCIKLHAICCRNLNKTNAKVHHQKTNTWCHTWTQVDRCTHTHTHTHTVLTAAFQVNLG